MIKIVEKLELEEFLLDFLPKLNPANRSETGIVRYLFPDIWKYNPEHCLEQNEKGRVWTLIEQDRDLYILPGIHKPSMELAQEDILGLIFTFIPNKNKEIIVSV